MYMIVSFKRSHRDVKAMWIRYRKHPFSIQVNTIFTQESNLKTNKFVKL